MDIRFMEILESAAWITLNFLLILGSIELACRPSDKRRSKNTMMGMIPIRDMLQK
jgi:hypothetical protein